jgi:polyisoprenoid-binding protein YceI
MREPGSPAHRQRGGAVLSLTIVAVVVVGAAVAFWWFVIRSDTEPAPELRTTETVPGGTLDGRWGVAPLLGSFVQYRVEEQFVAGALDSEATGRTSDVKGAMSIEGSTVSDVRIDVQMNTLESDKQERDKKLRTDGLQTDVFPTATFVLAEAIDLGAPPAKGKRIEANAVGDLTLHGVTQRVTLPLEGRWDGETVQVVGKIPITFADYGITPPNIGGFVTVADKGRMEIQLIFLKR